MTGETLRLLLSVLSVEKILKKGIKKVRDGSETPNELSDGRQKVRDHCHFTGKYRGCAHDDCNLQFAMRYYKVPFSFIILKIMTVI